MPVRRVVQLNADYYAAHQRIVPRITRPYPLPPAATTPDPVIIPTQRGTTGRPKHRLCDRPGAAGQATALRGSLPLFMLFLGASAVEVVTMGLAGIMLVSVLSVIYLRLGAD